jgi:hypothetical protein
MAYEYRLEDVNTQKTKEYEDAKKTQRQKQEEWAKNQKNAEKLPQLQT